MPFELIGGLRVLSLEVDLEVTIPPPIDATFSGDGGDDLYDVFAGARYHAPLGEHFMFSPRGHIAANEGTCRAGCSAPGISLRRW